MKGIYKLAGLLVAAGCSVTPLYEHTFSNNGSEQSDRGRVRIIHGSELSDNVRVYGQANLLTNPDEPELGIESCGGRGIITIGPKEGWHLTGNYVLKPGPDDPLLGGGYSGSFWRVQAKFRVGDEDPGDEIESFELEGALVHNTEKGQAVLLARFYPEYGSWDVRAWFQGKFDRQRPWVELHGAKPHDLDDVVISFEFGWGIEF